MINPQWLELPYLEPNNTVSKMFELLRFDCISSIKNGGKYLNTLYNWYSAIFHKEDNFDDKMFVLDIGSSSH